MPRRTDIKRSGFIIIPKNTDRLSYKFELIDSSGTTYDITNDVLPGTVNVTRVATTGVSNFSFNLDNSNGKYKDKFAAGDKFNLYFDFLDEVSTTVRFRGYIDGVFNNFDATNGFTLTIEGRDCPKSSTNEHFVDTFLTIQFSSRNNLDCFFGTTGDTDSLGNFENGLLYNSGLKLQVYDTADDTWKVWDDLNDSQRSTIKTQEGYTSNNTNNYIDVSRLNVARVLAEEGDYDFYIYYGPLANSKHEFYDTGDDEANVNPIITSDWFGQSFTVGTTGDNVNFIISSIKLKLYRLGLPGTLTVSIQALDGGDDPDGTDLSTGTIDGNTFTTSSSGNFEEITMSSFELQASTSYGIVVKALSGNGANWIKWRRDGSSPSYAGGTSKFSENSGSTWFDDNSDFMFEVYGADASVTYLRINPENVVENNNEQISIGQNLLSLSRYGRDTTTEVNRFKQSGFSDGSIILVRTKEDAVIQAQLWIKDKFETSNASITNILVEARALAKLNILKTSPNKGTLNCVGLPTLQPGEKVQVNIPYIVNEKIKVKNFNINLGEGLEFNMDLQDKETKFEDIFKERIDENYNVLPTNNPNGMSQALVFDFTNGEDYSLTNTVIDEDILSLFGSESEGVCVINGVELDENVTKGEVRIKADQIRSCSYRASNDDGKNWVVISPGFLFNFAATGKTISLEITLRDSSSGVSPEFDKVNFLVK